MAYQQISDITSDNGNSRDKKVGLAANAIERLAAGETIEQIKAGPRAEYYPTPIEKEAIQEVLALSDELPQYVAVPHFPNIIKFRHPWQGRAFPCNHH
ncbi:hypothetical protein RU07_16185 [Agrobacterium tumefaciens]|uniref:Uncharacterized protein n=1 Tax=Agrobacterium tumefaciens TaxID=358 RepID=A0A0D0JZD0_AGRTU|nr:hypothetical protein RU07_16185 [Agrobacterium tumefaciens]